MNYAYLHVQERKPCQNSGSLLENMCLPVYNSYLYHNLITITASTLTCYVTFYINIYNVTISKSAFSKVPVVKILSIQLHLV